MRNNKLYLQDILGAMESIEKFVEGMNFERFKEDDKTSSAVIRKFEIIGEATKHLPEDIKGKYLQIPWREMAGMRDRLIHFYFGIDHSLVWKTIEESLPKLISQLKKVIEEI